MICGGRLLHRSHSKSWLGRCTRNKKKYKKLADAKLKLQVTPDNIYTRKKRNLRKSKECMNTQQVTLTLPEALYLRLKQTAQATQQSLTDVLLHAVQVGSPSSWEDAPVAFQADLAALDRLDDEALWRTARS